MNDIILKYKNRIDDELNNIYGDGPELLIDPIRHVFSGVGKRLRPLLTLFTAKTFGLDIEKSINAAVSIEVLHNFTLVHDDIMDKDHLRHGKKTVNTKWDNDTALLAGDAMLALALKKLNNYSEKPLVFPTFTKGLLAVCEGQALDKEFETKADVNIDEYLNMIDFKTGYLIGLAAELGAIISDASLEEINLLKKFGIKIGRAFQIQDDILEIFSDTKTMGKSLKSDLILGKKTFLMIKGSEYNPNFSNEVRGLISEDYESGIIKIRKILKDNNIYQQGVDVINDNFNDANLVLNSLAYDVKYLQYFTNLINNRKF